MFVGRTREEKKIIIMMIVRVKFIMSTNQNHHLYDFCDIYV